MDPLTLLIKIGIYCIMILAVIAAAGVVLLPNLFHAALCLAAVLFSAAFVFFALHAEFLAVVQILLYVGAVMTLVIFAIMLTTRMSDTHVNSHNKLGIAAVAVATVFFTVMAQFIYRTSWLPQNDTVGAHVSTGDLGAALMGRFVFPFEVISVLLIGALIGAVVVARKEDPS